MRTAIAITAAGMLAALSLSACQDEKKPDAKPDKPAPAATTAAHATATGAAASAKPAAPGGGW